MAEPLLAIDEVVLSLPDRRRRLPFRRVPRIPILHGVSIALRRGEALGVVGESGSGKTSLARLAAGILKPDSGTVRFAGGDRRVQVQMIFQDPLSALNPRRRIGTTVLRPLEAAGWRADRAGRRAMAAGLLARVGLPAGFADRYPHELSGGQRQRVGIARALGPQPALIVADEIVSGLDVSTQAQILDLLAALKAEFGLALLFISHDLAVVRHLCERVAVMREGRIVETGPSEILYADPQHPYTRALLDAVPPLRPDPHWLDAVQPPKR